MKERRRHAEYERKNEERKREGDRREGERKGEGDRRGRESESEKRGQQTHRQRNHTLDNWQSDALGQVLIDSRNNT